MSDEIKPDNAIAIVGMWCRVPGANTPEEFWDNLCAGVQSVSRISRDELIESGVPPALIDDQHYVPYRGILQNATAFDQSVFGISPAEATLTDPQHRQFLECAYLALLDAGIEHESKPKIGVYATQSRNQYREACDAPVDSVRGFSADIFNGISHLATNVAYRLGCQGPAITVQSACSSSLVAVHLACQALRDGDCDYAIAGGVSVGWPQHTGYLYVPDGIMSRDGHCRPFDESAAGTVRGEGVGVIVLRRYAEAAEPGSGVKVKGIIRSSAINNDGSQRMGFAAPSADGQVRVIKAALDKARLGAGSVECIEAHGTGTAVGDAIELSALAEALHGDEAVKAKVWLGSAKANLGHLDAAAGIIGLIKATLSISHRLIPPLPGFSKFSPQCASDAAGFRCAESLVPWESKGLRRAGVSSFGLGGTNAHIILEEAPPVAPPIRAGHGAPSVFTLGVRHQEDLEVFAAELYRLAVARDLRPIDIAFTLALRPSTGAIRASLLVAKIDDLGRTDIDWSAISGRPEKIGGITIFLAPIPVPILRAVLDLYLASPLFQRQFLGVANRVKLVVGVDTVAELQRMGASAKCEGIALSYVTFCIHYATVQVLKAMQLVIGDVYAEGVGEYVAACITGGLTIDEAIELIGISSGERNIADIEAFMDDISPRDGAGWTSCASGVLGTSKDMTAEHWIRALTDSPGAGPQIVRTLSKQIEPVLILGSLETHSVTSPAWVSLFRSDARGLNGHSTFLEALGQAWRLGLDVHWAPLLEEQGALKIPLPVTSTHRTRFAPKSKISSTMEVREQPMNTATESEKLLEGLVKGSFEQVLEIKNVKSDDNFFHLGGCSLTALDVIERISQATGHTVSLKVFLDEPTPSTLARELLKNRERPSPAIAAQVVPKVAVPVAGRDIGMPVAPVRALSFSAFFFSGQATSAAKTDIYGLLLEAAKFADESGFEAVWVPERHFHSFGGLFPSPAVLGAALAVATSRIAIRAGSVVLPLHNPIEVVEQWAVVDNLSGGRVGLSVAPGFHPTDFTINPANFNERRSIFWSSIDEVQRLWRGDTFEGVDGLGRASSVRPLPRPLQGEMPLWITASESEESFLRAGEKGANILTGLLAMDVNTLQKRIAVYRESLRKHHPEKVGRVTTMVHTYVDPDEAEVTRVGRQALWNYLENHLDFASARASHEKINAISATDKAALLDHATDRYLNGASLIGTPQKCIDFSIQLAKAGVDEIACLMDFGVERSDAMASLREVSQIQKSLRARL